MNSNFSFVHVSVCLLLASWAMAAALSASPDNDDPQDAKALIFNQMQSGSTVGANTSWPVRKEGEEEGEKEGETTAEGEAAGEGEIVQEGEQPLEGEKEGESPEEGEQEGESLPEGEYEGEREGETFEGEREGETVQEGEILEGEMIQEGEIASEGESPSLASITLLGSDLRLECGHSTFVDPGVRAFDDDGITSLDDKISIAIYSDAMGNTTEVSAERRDVYDLFYSITSSSGKVKTVSRRVEINDALSPLIVLEGENLSYVGLGASYEEKGVFSANDFCDGNLLALSNPSESIVVKIKTGGLTVDQTTLGAVEEEFNDLFPVLGRPEYQLEYEISDRSGNKGLAQRIVRMSQASMELLGATAMTLECGEAFIEPGIIAVDDDGLSVLEEITVTALNRAGEMVDLMNLTVPDTYTLTYSVLSSAGIQLQANRMITVQDTLGPIIKLGGQTELRINAGNAYAEAGIESITDQCDASISDVLNNPASISVTIKSGWVVHARTNLAEVEAIFNAYYPSHAYTEYVFEYKASDQYGNTSIATRTVRLYDSLSSITLLGASNITLECGDTFADPGAVALNDDGSTPITDISTSYYSDAVGNTTVLPSKTPGIVTITYRATSSDAVPLQTIRTLTIADRIAPEVTLNGETEVIVSLNAPYIEAGIASAVDQCDGNLSEMLTVAPETIPVVIRLANESLVGNSTLRDIQQDFYEEYSKRNGTDYLLRYRVADAAGNVMPVTRLVHVSKASLALTGGDMQLECTSGVFTDPGYASVEDDGVTPLNNVVITYRSQQFGEVEGVDLGAIDIYTIHYSAVSSLGIPLSATRTVSVTDVSPPVIALRGSTTVTLTCDNPYAELGLTSIVDQCEGNLSSLLQNPGNLSVSVLNAGTLEVLLETNLAEVESAFHAFYLDHSILAYRLDYKVPDGSGNIGMASRMVNDKRARIQLMGEPSSVVECGTSFTDPGVEAWDEDCQTPLTEITVSVQGESSGTLDDINTNQPDTYTLTYAVVSSAGAALQISRTVVVQDTTAPTVYLKEPKETIIGKQIPYVEAGIGLIEDVCDGDLSELLASPENIPVAILLNNENEDWVGNSNLRDIAADFHLVYSTRNDVSYLLKYHVTDSSGNTGIDVRTVHISQAQIALLGAQNIILECGSSEFTDPGYTAVDDDGLSLLQQVDIMIVGETSGIVDSVNTGVVDTYVMTYSAVSSEFIPVQAVRMVQVKDTNAPIITLQGLPRVMVGTSVPYVEAGIADAIDLCDGDLSSVLETPEAVVVNIQSRNEIIAISSLLSVADDLNALYPSREDIAYTLEYCLWDAGGNKGTVARWVDISQGKILLNGDTVMTLECGGSPFTEPGYVAMDDDGTTPLTNVDISIVSDAFGPTDSVRTDIVDRYTITYSALSSILEELSKTRTIHIVDGLPPVIELAGTAEIIIGCEGEYAESGITAITDLCDGDLSDLLNAPEQIRATILNADTLALLAETNLQEVASVFNTLCVYPDPRPYEEYRIGYHAADGAGNNSIVYRSVIVHCSMAYIDLQGEAEMTVSCGMAFTDPGSVAVDDNGVTPLTVSRTGSVNTSVVGTYILTYSSHSSEGINLSVSRQVNVVDDEGPTIRLKGRTNILLDCGQAYVDDGLQSVIDVCDGNLLSTLNPLTTPVNIWLNAALLYRSNLQYMTGGPRNLDILTNTSPAIAAEYSVEYIVKDRSDNEGKTWRTVSTFPCP